VPIALAEPIGSHDLWAYAAQGNLYLHGVDPYRYGPAQLPGAYNLQVSPIWRHTPAPYGPLFLAMARVAVSAAGPHVDTAVRLLKLLAFASFVITVLLLPALCRAFRVDDTTAMWLFAANPLILLVGVGGGHNDLIITGLLAVGLWLVTRPGGLLTTLVPAALVVALAAEVKIPAAIALVFLPHIWRLTRRRGGVPPPLLPSCVAVAVCGVVVAAATVIGTGLGFGWVHRLSAADTGITWLSVPITLVLADEWAHARVHVPLATSHLTYAGALAAQLSSVLAVVLLVPLWWLARRRDPTLLLGVALALAVVLSTSVWPWYLSWVLLVGVLAGLRRGVLVGIAGISLGLMLGVGPDGVTSFNVDQGIGLIMLAALVTWALLVLPVPRTTVPSWRSI
jgi:alpha-1,6-mannosyltransferase